MTYPPHCQGIGFELDQPFPGPSPDSVLIQDSPGSGFNFAVPAQPRTHIVVLYSLIVELHSDHFAFRVGQGLNLEITEGRPVLPLSIEVPEPLQNICVFEADIKDVSVSRNLHQAVQVAWHEAHSSLKHCPTKF